MARAREFTNRATAIFSSSASGDICNRIRVDFVGVFGMAVHVGDHAVARIVGSGRLALRVLLLLSATPEDENCEEEREESDWDGDAEADYDAVVGWGVVCGG